jgi:hypothetical protein
VERLSGFRTVLSFSVTLRRFGRQTALCGGCALQIGLFRDLLRNLRRVWLENDRTLRLSRASSRLPGL